jgi:hypothetical protein
MNCRNRLARNPAYHRKCVANRLALRTPTSVNPTVQVLRAESKRLRSLAEKIDSLIAEIDDTPSRGPTADNLPGLRVANTPNPNGEFAGLSQPQAVLKVLEYGPQTYREIFQRLNAGGKLIRDPSHVSSLLARLKDKVRNEGGKYYLIHSGITIHPIRNQLI